MWDHQGRYPADGWECGSERGQGSEFSLKQGLRSGWVGGDTSKRSEWNCGGVMVRGGSYLCKGLESALGHGTKTLGMKRSRNLSLPLVDCSFQDSTPPSPLLPLPTSSLFPSTLLTSLCLPSHPILPLPASPPPQLFPPVRASCSCSPSLRHGGRGETIAQMSVLFRSVWPPPQLWVLGQ